MVIQFEDCIDCLKAIYADQFEYLFYFDHSSGHDKLRPDGLNKNTMNKGYGGKQKKNAIINNTKQYLSWAV